MYVCDELKAHIPATHSVHKQVLSCSFAQCISPANVLFIASSPYELVSQPSAICSVRRHLHDTARQRDAAALISITLETLGFTRLVARWLDDRGGAGGREDEVDRGGGGG